MKETIKTIVITALATAIVTFLIGVHYGQGNSQNTIQAAQSLLKVTAQSK